MANENKALEVLGKLRTLFEKVRHHKQFNKRVADVFKNAMSEYVIVARAPELFGSRYLYNMEIWGNGIEHSGRIYLSWHSSEAANETWATHFLAELDRQDPSDSMERAKQEGALVPELQDIEKQIQALRARAASMVKALPIPASAKTRASEVHWSGPSTFLVQKFPGCFG